MIVYDLFQFRAPHQSCTSPIFHSLPPPPPPCLVAFFLHRSPGSPGLCAGALISRRHVLTSFHCTYLKKFVYESKNIHTYHVSVKNLTTSFEKSSGYILSHGTTTNFITSGREGMDWRDWRDPVTIQIVSCYLNKCHKSWFLNVINHGALTFTLRRANCGFWCAHFWFQENWGI